MAVNSKTYDFLTQFCVEGMEKAHEEQRKANGNGKPLCFRRSELYFAPIGVVEMSKLGNIITDSTRPPTEDCFKANVSSTREHFISKPVKAPKRYMEALSCSFDIPANSPLHDILMSEVENIAASLTIEGRTKINKPHNLKYPNKKRARRIWKKWAKRFGTTAQTICLPNMEIGVCPDENGLLTYHITAKR